MASIFDIVLQETGGPDALTAFEYQHRIAVGELLRLVNESNRDFIEFDSHDDILVRTTNTTPPGAEFIQVKAHTSRWTPSDLYSDESDSVPTAGKYSSSLVAKQLRRAIGDEAAAFRVITKLGVNHELEILEQEPATRDPIIVTKLKDKLVSRFADFSFPKDRTVSDWIDQMRWKVSGLEQAVDDRNLHAIADAVFSHFKRTLTPDQASELYQHLLSRARRAATISEPREQKGCTRAQLLTWLHDFCAKMPVHLCPDIRVVIDTLDRESHERCVGRWLIAGVSPNLAQALAADENVGANAVRWMEEQEQSDDFLWVNGQFGSGKSLAAERLFQKALRSFQDGRQTRIPVFVEAKALSRPLGEEIETRAAKLGDYYRQSVYVIIDGADERTHQEARQLVQDAASYARAHAGSKVLITSSILMVSGLEAKTLPQLSEAEANALLRRLDDSHAFRFHYLDGRFRADLENPFFIIQCTRFGTGLSRAELVRRMVAVALERVETAIQPAEDLLVRLAQWQFDHGSPLIPEREIGSSRASITSVLQTRLLEKRGDCFSFTLECVAQWFAAQAIERGLVLTSDLLDDTARLERWQFALAMALNHANADLADQIMQPLAEAQPAFAGLVLRDGLLEWGIDKPNDKVAAEEVAQRVRDAMQSWKVGMEPVSNLEGVFPLNAEKKLLKISATCHGGYFHIKWYERPDLVEVSTKEDVSFVPTSGEHYWSSTILDHPAWAWKTTHNYIKGGLKKVTDETSLAAVNEHLLRELGWAEGCDLLGQSQYRSAELPVSGIVSKLPYGFRNRAHRQLLELYINILVENGGEVIKAPYPQGDQEAQGKMWQFFSQERMTQRAVSVYQTALVAYREVVEAIFPKMAARFPRYAAWPFDLAGIVFSPNNLESNGYALGWRMESLPPGSKGVARFTSGSQEDADLLWKDRLGSNQLRDITKPSWSLKAYGNSGLMLWDSFPAGKIVRNWIESDLRAVGWL